ncbi:hypothetical protein [Flavobacterium rhizosphaerae]|uniref:Uncharacterized protein n=1 Tax=Flavobacterium rhizosphaerae TaxID=3163298 RepID=A0ABW8YWU9_9FLAO
MHWLKKYGNTKAGSLLESVIALCIIAVCIYVTIIVFSRIYLPASSVRASHLKNKMFEIAILKEIGADSLSAVVNKNNLHVKEELDGNLVKMTITANDSIYDSLEQIYYYKE